MIPLAFLAGLFVVGAILLTIIRQLSGWNSMYEKLAKRYGGNFFGGYLISKPSMTFSYGRSFCRVHNRKTLRYRTGKKTEMILGFPDNSLKIEITTLQRQPNRWNPLRLSPVTIEEPGFQDINVFSNNESIAKKLLSTQVQWQIEQLRQHMGNGEIQITISRGKLIISKPGYIKNAMLLDDFVRYGLELYDLMLLTDVQGIEFLGNGKAEYVAEIKCPICAELIEQQIVTCVRCKTPHCYDCWQYNGQCATFACNETRYVKSNGQIVTP